MGEVVGAALLAHVPTIVLPEKDRRELNNGVDTTLVAGLRELRRDVFEVLDYDTVVVLDSHWATTVEFVVTAQERRAGLFTSEELPRGMVRRPYDFPGDPELARAVAAKADEHGTWITAIDDPYLPIFYATTNLWEYLGRGLDKRWISIGVCQTADTEDNLRLGRPGSVMQNRFASAGPLGPARAIGAGERPATTAGSLHNANSCVKHRIGLESVRSGHVPWDIRPGRQA